ncbi:MAG TPA: lipocalin-like domain-containing protein [Acidimicrobiia bacterium]|nr:lipocalin-like domain-containing protein [Acidimicrobiia bacterium]
MLKPDDLVGTWRLRSWKNTGSDGSVVDPLGENPVGFISYHDHGYMSVEIMAEGRTPFRDDDVLGGTPEERSAAISTYLGYAGPFEVRADEGAVVHHIEVCSFPNWVGDAQVRFAELDGDTLTLSTKPMTFQGVERTAALVWDRVGRA